MPIHRLLPGAKQVLRTHDYSMLPTVLKDYPPNDLADLMSELPATEQMIILRSLPRKKAVEAFQYLLPSTQEHLLQAMAREEAVGILNEMSPDDRTLLLEELTESKSKGLLDLMAPEERAVAMSLLEYPEGSVGRLMTPDLISVRQDWTVQQVLDFVREKGQDSETLNVIYVVDENNLLQDDIRIREFLLAPLERRVSELMDHHYIALQVTDSQETAVTIFKQEDRTALPVVDANGVLLGIVTIDDVLDVAEAVATEDIQKIGGMEALDEPYMQIGFWRMVQKRAGWLVLLFLGEMLTATAMGYFEKEISRAIVLALFIPLIISSGGNSGSQASTLVIRALALSEVKGADWWRVMRREIFSGLALGTVLGSIGFLRISIWSIFSNIYDPHPLMVALTVGVALVGVVLWGTLSGSLLPFILRRLGFDPATSSAPFVATLVDVTGLVIYFTIASLILHGTLL
ncbi:MAG: magnesium transporter [Terriglobia bacterium]